MKNFKIFRNIFLIICISIIAGTLLMTLAYCFPLNREKVASMGEVLYEQGTMGDYPLIHAGEQYFNSFRPGVFDGGSVGIMVDYSTRDISPNSPLRAAMVEQYSRYWHGYVTVLRPLLYFFHYKDLEILFSFVLLIMAFLIVSRIAQRKRKLYIFAFISSFLLLMPMVVGICLQYIWVAFLAYGGVLCFLEWENQLSKENRYLYFFLILGILTCFFDLLTYPVYTWGIPAVCWLVLEKKACAKREAVIFVITSVLAWSSGYLGMWMGKLLVGSIVLRENIFGVAFYQIKYRTGVSLSIGEKMYSVYKNWKHYSYGIYALILFCWLILFLYYGFFYGWKRSEKTPAFVLIALSSPVWNMAASEHMDVHHMFTYRIYRS